MKVNRTKILLAASAALISLSGSLSAQSFSGRGALPKNRAVLSSPRTLEEYPEILRSPPLGREERKAERLAKLTENRALAASPRFREEHPELLRLGSDASAQSLVAKAVQKRERLDKMAENRALLASPRFLEEHPEVLRGKRIFEIAPLK